MSEKAIIENLQNETDILQTSLSEKERLLIIKENQTMCGLIWLFWSSYSVRWQYSIPINSGCLNWLWTRLGSLLFYLLWPRQNMLCSKVWEKERLLIIKENQTTKLETEVTHLKKQLSTNISYSITLEGKNVWHPQRRICVVHIFVFSFPLVVISRHWCLPAALRWLRFHH
jgi:hypothetical protein